MKKLPDGLWPVMLTPFHDKKELDLESLVELTEFYIETGADGLFANCLSSEMFQLTSQERLLITKTVVEAVTDRIPVVATGGFGNDIQGNADFIKAIYDTGIAAVVLNSNQLCEAKEPEAAFIQKVEQILDATGDIPMGLYECPIPYKRILSPDAVNWLAKTGRFLYLKDTSCDADMLRRKIEMAKGSHLKIYNANTPTGPGSILDGGAGMSPIGANYFPELFAKLLHADHQISSIGELSDFLNVFDSLVHESYPMSAKWFLKRRGLNISTACRGDDTPIDKAHELKLESMYKLFLRLASGLKEENVQSITS